MDSGLKREIEEKVLSGSRLSFDDGLALYDTDEVAWLGELAHEARTRRHGGKVLFAVEQDDVEGSPVAATLLYGHIEEPRHLVDHVLRLREQQDETGGLAVFVPLRQQEAEPAATGVEALKVFAVSRLLLDNVDHVRCSLAAHSLATAQLALNYGADDLDGWTAGGATSRDELLELIRDAGFTPVERDRGYAVVEEYDGPEPMRREEPQLMTF